KTASGVSRATAIQGCDAGGFGRLLETAAGEAACLACQPGSGALRCPGAYPGLPSAGWAVGGRLRIVLLSGPALGAIAPWGGMAGPGECAVEGIFGGVAPGSGRGGGGVVGVAEGLGGQGHAPPGQGDRWGGAHPAGGGAGGGGAGA